MRQHAVVAAVALAVGLLAGLPSGAGALEPVAGTYRCAGYNVSGGGGSCRTFQPLILEADGTYRYSSTRGRWSVRDGRLHLSESALWGPGEILGPDTLRFQYEYRGWHHTVTFVCAECGRSAGAAPPSPGAAAAPGTGFAGVSLVLDFDAPVGGVTSFVIVPAEAARGYAHGAPLPEGAVQGLAWERGSTTVALATGRNKLRTGRRYVVFLSWPRESVPVAVLDLPRVAGDYSGTLRGTLDGRAVLAAVGAPRESPPPPPVEAPAPEAAPPPVAVPPGAPGGGQGPDASGSVTDFVNALRDLWRGFEELARSGRKRDGAGAPAQPVVPPPPVDPAPALPPPSPSPYQAGPPAPPAWPPAADPAPAGPAAGAGAPGAPRCHPLVPRYSQPGCVE